MTKHSRRAFAGQIAAAGALAALTPNSVIAQLTGERPTAAAGIKVLNPRGRVPVGLIIDDSTCLVNLAHFCISHFAEVFPDRYKQNWKGLPREIPDAFVRKFGEWCGEHGVKGKYSLIPYPACVGWLDRDIPGWSKRELEDSLKLVRTLLSPNWDFHPEMITHTWAIDIKTGRPFVERSERVMENWGFSVGKSASELGDYLAFALRILKNAGIRCEGITTPGGFGTRVLPELAQATLQSCRDVFQAEVPHYFRHLFTDDQSVAPRVEYASGLDGADPKCVVSIIGCTGDWFGGWDGLERGSVEKFITEDLRGGRLPEVIARGEPAIMVSHWPGMYFNGEEAGFNILKGIVARLDSAYKNLIWMKLSEIARYWAAKELTRIEGGPGKIQFHAPFHAPDFTIQVAAARKLKPTVNVEGRVMELTEVSRPLQLAKNTCCHVDNGTICCFDLPKGASTITLHRA